MGFKPVRLIACNHGRLLAARVWFFHTVPLKYPKKTVPQRLKAVDIESPYGTVENHLT
jgi:hypothetical protein